MFPAEAVPVSVLVSTLASHAIALSVLLAATALWGHPPGWTLVALPVWTLLAALFSLGLSWVVAALQVYLRDTAQVLSVVLTAWFWVTPVFLPESFYRGRLDMVLDWNPVRYLVLGYRGSILGGPLPSPYEFAAVSACAACSLVLGGLFFRSAKRGFADVM